MDGVRSWIVEHPLVNTTSYFMTLALLLAVLHVLSQVEHPVMTRALLTGLLVGGIAAMKNTALPFALMLCLLREMQNVMKPGTTALVCLDKPFLLNFERNTLYVADFAAAGPSPGLPLDSNDNEKWIGYLRAHSVHYIVYGYGNEAGFSASRLAQVIQHPRTPPWQRALLRGIITLHERLLAISAHWPRVYDDGRIVVIDISARP